MNRNAIRTPLQMKTFSPLTNSNFIHAIYLMGVSLIDIHYSFLPIFTTNLQALRVCTGYKQKIIMYQ